MEKMRLFWSSRSPFARKVTVCSHELRLAPRLDLVPVTVATSIVNPDVSLYNPLSKIPTLVLADGTALLDSAVICEFLNALGGGDLIPEDPPLRWRALTIQAIADGLLDALILLRNERTRKAPDEAITSALQTKCDQALGRLEDEVATLKSDAPGIGEIATGCVLGYLDFRFPSLDWRTNCPDLARLHDELARRPSFDATQHRDN